MALTGTFNADFSGFVSAVQRAEVSLKSFEQGSGKVETALTRMSNSLSGTKIIQDATLMTEAVERVGGVSKLTEKELARVSATAQEAAAKMRAMGVDVPPGIQRIADATKNVDTAQGSLIGTVKTLTGAFAGLLTARAVFNFAADVVKDASALKDLSQQVHINVEELQLLSRAMSEFGVDANTLGNALYTLSRKAAGGDDSVANALHLMGMSLKDIQGLAGEDLFLTILNGLSRLQGGLRDTAAAELFGSRLGASMAGASVEIERTLEKLRNISNVSNQGAVDNLDKIDEAIKRIKSSIGSFAANSVFGPLALEINAVTDASTRGASAWQILTTYMEGSAGGSAAAVAALNALAGGLEESTTAASGHAAVLSELAQQWNAMAGIGADAITKLTAAQRENLATLDTWGRLTKENAAAIGVSAAAFAAYVTELNKGKQATKEFEDSVRNLTSAHDAAVAAIGDRLFGHDDIARAKSYLEAIGSVANASGLAADAQADVVRVMQSGIVALEAAGLGSEKLATSMREIEKAAAAAGPAGKKAFDDIAGAAHRAAAAADNAAAAIHRARQAAATEEVRRAAAANAGGVIRPPLADTGKTQTFGGSFAASYTDSNGTTWIWDVARNQYVPQFRPSPRATGGPVRDGQPYLVGERGPELFVPRGDGRIVPSVRDGKGIGGVVNNVFHVNGTAQQVARDIADTIMQTLKFRRQFSSA